MFLRGHEFLGMPYRSLIFSVDPLHPRNMAESGGLAPHPLSRTIRFQGGPGALVRFTLHVFYDNHFSLTEKTVCTHSGNGPLANNTIPVQGSFSFTIRRILLPVVHTSSAYKIA